MTNAPEARPVRVVFWGTYDLSKPRTRILREGLQKAGAEVIEIHADVWSKFADKSQMTKAAMALTLLQIMFIYPALIYRYIRAPHHDVVLVPYLGQFDVIVLRPFAWAKSKPVVWDMFLSLYDTVVNDRKMVRKWMPPAVFLKSLEWIGCRAASRVLLDTKAHADYISELFNLPPGRACAVPVGAETDVFPRLAVASPHDGPANILFYGQFIPLHGIDTILQAALSERGRAHQWRIIGKGQQSGLVAQKLQGVDAPHIQREDWLPYGSLIAAIEQSDICLGIFGASRKAASVVPNKVYQCLFAGRTVITRQSPAMTETFPSTPEGLRLIPPEDPVSLLDAIDAARKLGFPNVPDRALNLAQPAEIGQLLCDTVLAPLLKKPQSRE